MCEPKYPQSVSNPVIIKKNNGDWRVCVDFIDLNKTCAKDNFSHPKID